MTLKKIKIYGKLRKFLGQASFVADVASPVEAIKFLLCNYPHLENHFYQHHYKIKMGDQDIPLDMLHLRGEDDIQIIPVVAGSGIIAAVFGAVSSGAAAVATAASAIPVVGGIVAGAAGVVGSVATGIATAATTVAALPVVGGVASAVATSVAIEGVTSLITPTPSIPDPPVSSAAEAFSQNDPQLQGSNYSFSGIQNVSRSGVCVPIIYGERFVGSVIVSNGVDTVQVDGTA
tara:strand:+ start:1692 stop:2390 length:699 start_codon:yes stop_codon:yes gene_type:complete